MTGLYLLVLLFGTCCCRGYETINYTTTRIPSCPKTSLPIYKTTLNATNNKGVIIAFPGTAFNVPKVLKFEPQAFAQLGYTFYQVNTRVYTTHRTRAKCAMQDGKDAFKYIYQQLVKPNTKVYIYGSSAGGAISLNMMTNFGPKITAYVLVGPLVDIVAFYNRGGQRKALPTRNYAYRLSPMNRIPARSKIPPILATVGEKDVVTPFKPNLVKYMNRLANKHPKSQREVVEIISADLGKHQVSPTGKYKIVYYPGGAHGFQDLDPEEHKLWIQQDLVQRANDWYELHSD